MGNQQQNTAAIYCRLSRDDGGDSESNSISNQRELLQRYARDHGFIVRQEYIDDGISGTTFERDGFKRMITDIEEGKISSVICKDLSRLGRNNALVAYYTEIFFPENDIQFIAVNDNIDTFHGENEIMGFKSILNEYYACDISKKVRSTYRMLAVKGDFVGSLAPYGYQRDLSNKHHLIIDEETAPIVKIMFEMAAQGIGCEAIRREFRRREILTPLAYIAGKTGKYQTETVKKYPTDWNTQTVISILKNKAYCGHLVQQKKTVKSFKNKKHVYRPKSEWVEARNTHEAIIDEQTFDIVQSFLVTKKRENVLHEDNIFAGMLKCSTCNHALTFNINVRYRNKNYFCNLYRRSTKRCTAHFITLNVIYNTVLYDIQKKAALAKEYSNSYEEFLRQFTQEQANNSAKAQQKELERCRKRCSELDAIIKQLFEQNVTGVITEERFVILSADYESEELELKKRMEALVKQINKQKRDVDNTSSFFNIISKYTDLTELTKPILHELIEKIVVYDGEGAGRSRKQKVEIYYRFVGLLPG